MQSWMVFSDGVIARIEDLKKFADLFQHVLENPRSKASRCGKVAWNVWNLLLSGANFRN